jgi:hypothetical protein
MQYGHQIRDVIVCVFEFHQQILIKPSADARAQASAVPFDTHGKLIQVIAIVTPGVTELITSTHL